MYYNLSIPRNFDCLTRGIIVLISAVELGIDSHEMRELFLSKIYELSNPSSSVGAMEDDFLCES